MGELGIEGVTRRRFRGTTKRDAKARPASDLVRRNFSAEGPDQLWVADITHVRESGAGPTLRRDAPCRDDIDGNPIVCLGNNESAGKRRGGRARRGNGTLREGLIECAHAAARTHHCQFRGYHKALTIRRGYKRATVATAHNLLPSIT